MNCKPGDLAIIIRAHLSENVGAIVEVIAPCEYFGEGYWHCRSCTPRRGVIGDRVVSAAKEHSILDAWMRPISGVPVDDEVKDDIKEPA